MSKLMLIMTVVISGISYANNDKLQVVKKEQELMILKAQLDYLQDSLEYETTNRYTFKQQLVEQKETNKIEYDRLREQQERIDNQYSLAKEEILSKEQLLIDERKTTLIKADELALVKNTLKDLMQKEASRLTESFPTQQELRQSDFEDIRRRYVSDHDAAYAFQLFASYKSDCITKGTTLTIERSRLIPQESGPTNMTIARFGNVFAYGLDTAGHAYLIHQTGRLGGDRYAINKIGDIQLLSFVNNHMPNWVHAGKPIGPIMVDVMQNEQTRLLISGKQSSWWMDMYHSFKQGGLIMIPLLLLPFWIFYLVLHKLIQINFRQRQITILFEKTMKATESGLFDELLVYLRKQKGAMAQIIQTCIEYREKDRHSCERAIRDIIFHEVPIINRGINTVAVIAGAAPLLGLLGTISGMITLFSAVTQYGTGDPKFLAGGISEALITAKTGLAIAIPALFLHNWLKSSKEALLARTEECISRILNRLWTKT